MTLVLGCHGGYGYLFYDAWPVFRVCRELVLDMTCHIGLTDRVLNGLILVNSGTSLPLNHQHFIALVLLVPSEVFDMVSTGTGFAGNSHLLFTMGFSNILSSKRCNPILMILVVPTGLIAAQLLITVNRGGRSLAL